MRYGCRKCGTRLPSVQAGETLRVRCSKHSCQFVNVIPADPKLAPWEARGETRLLVVDDTQGAVLLAPPAAKTASHKFAIVLAVLLVIVIGIAFPPIRHKIIFGVAVHEIQNTTDAANAERWCERLAELGPAAQAASPIVWNLHFQHFAGGKVLKENFINSVLNAIDPGDLASRKPKLSDKSSVGALSVALKFPEPNARIQAVELLGDKGPNARDAVEELTAIAGNTQDPASRYAIEALERIGPAASSAVPELITLLGVSGASRAAAAQALRRIAPDDTRVLSALDNSEFHLPSTRPGNEN